MFNLDSRNRDQVASHHVIEADLGVGGKRLVIASGIAVPHWRLDSDELHRREARVNLHISADRLLQATVHLGLASVGNDDTEHIFAVDTGAVIVSPEGELILTANLALLGEPSSLNRFSYQVVAVISRAVNEITGTIKWPRAVWSPPDVIPSTVSQYFSVAANLRTTTPLTGGGFGGVSESLVPAVEGEIVDVQVGDESVLARYRIANPPRNRELRITCLASIPGVPAEFSVGPVDPPRAIFTLDANSPSRSDVNFIGAIWRGPR